MPPASVPAPVLAGGEVRGGFGGDAWSTESSGVFVAVWGGDAGPTVVTFVGNLVGETVGCFGGSRRDWSGAGVILAGLARSPRAVVLRPVENGSGAILRGGILEAGEVITLGSGVRMLIACMGLIGLPM